MTGVNLIPDAASANDITPDGRYIVGGYDPDGDGFQNGAYRLDRTTGNMAILGGPGLNAKAISDDGSVIMNALSSSTIKPCRPMPVIRGRMQSF